ncbi:MAG TPA: MazG nucleotide pyrophosphohydrolase domain-containing protein [Candidatus Saccharimonadales bacterium]|nr:MazG nucleotide pyrophosphohydrolase domain-containing protein [Candidatus Saccharimonadales bacterium]
MAKIKPTLDNYQELVKKLVVERGFDKETVPEVFLVFAEEVGEFAKTIRKANNQKTNTDARHHNMEDEAADVFFMLIDLCNRLGIDLAKAFAAKEKKNQERTWS